MPIRSSCTIQLLLMPRVGYVKVRSMAQNLSVCMSCLVFEPSFKIVKSLFVIKLMINKELSSFLLQWNSHSLLSELKSPNIIKFLFKFAEIFVVRFLLSVCAWGGGRAYIFCNINSFSSSKDAHPGFFLI